MKRLLFVLLLLSPFLLSAHHLLPFVHAGDTTIQKDTVRITPYLAETSTKALGNFAVTTHDKYAFQTYAGFNVLNTLRGHVPNLGINPNAWVNAGGLRSASSSSLVIDGLLYNSSIHQYQNLNAFEFKNAYALSSGNASTLYGGAASNGVFVLESKTGKDVDKPTVEFNTSPSLSWNKNYNPFNNESTTTRQWYITNAVAYMQDFGPVDVRASYMFNRLPDSNAAGDAKSGNHNAKLNAGFDITPRLNARVILDQTYLKNTSEISGSAFNGQVTTSQNDAVRKNRQGNLMLRYRVLDWLTISSQSSLAKSSFDSDVRTEITTTSTYLNRSHLEQDQKRRLANIFVSLNRPLNSWLGVTAFVGAQHEKQKATYEYAYTNGGTYMRAEYKTNTLSGGAGLQFYKMLFADFQYRNDHISALPSDKRDKPTYSTSLAFAFSDLFAQNTVFQGKIRGSFGKSHFLNDQAYPNAMESNLYGIPVNPFIMYPGAAEFPVKRMREVGTDLYFFKNRLNLTGNYFQNVNSKTYALIPMPGSGYSSVLINLGEQEVKGWEFILGGAPVQRHNVSWNAKLIYSTYDVRIRRAEGISGSDDFPGINLGSSYPDWRGSILNQVAVGNFFTTFLIDTQHGGNYIATRYVDGSGNAVLTTVDASQARLRDISFGYSLSPGLLDRLHLQQVQVSLSLRNMWTIYSKAEDVDITFDQRSAALSLSLTF